MCSFNQPLINTKFVIAQFVLCLEHYVLGDSSFQDVVVDKHFRAPINSPIEESCCVVHVLESFQLFKKRSLPCHQEGKKGLMSCKNYANGMEDWCASFFCVCHHLQQVPRSTHHGWANASYSWSLSSMLFNAIVLLYINMWASSIEIGENFTICLQCL